MGSCGGFESVCRLCGLECHDLIALFPEGAGRQRDLPLIIRTYLRVKISIQDSLPQQVCGPCVAKLDEVVDFVDSSHTTQTKLKSQLQECQTDSSSMQVNEEKVYELIQDVKVELEESQSQFVDDLKDEDYDPHTSRQQRRKAARGRRRVVAPRGPSSRPPKRVRSKAVEPGMNGVDGRGAENTEPSTTPLKAEEWMENHTRKEEVAEAHTEGSFPASGNPLSCDKLDNTVKSAVRCSLCKSSFAHFEQLSAHSQEAHQLAEPSYMCPQCPLVFSKATSLRTHQRRKHQDSLQMCPQCNKLYPPHYLWTRHMLVHTNSRPFSCDECDKKFKSKAEMFNHKRIHRPSEERYTHCCEVCGKRFTQKANLESHLRLHTGNRPFSCEFCGKCFSQRGNMEEHRRIHTGEKPFVCDLCGMSYSRQGQLSMHRRQHSGVKPHKCQFCEKEFLRREVLKKHEHMHTDTRPYKCSYCDKSFRDQGKRKVHERLHTGERPFECQFCGRGFCESGNLSKHLRVHQRRPGSVVSTTKEKGQSSFTPELGHTGAPDKGSSYNYNPVPTTTFSVPGLAASRHSADTATMGNSTAAVITEPIHLAPASSHPDPHPQEPLDPTPPPLPPLGSIPSHSPSLATLHQMEDSQENTTLPPQGCERVEYRVASPPSYQPATTWTVYHG